MLNRLKYKKQSINLVQNATIWQIRKNIAKCDIIGITRIRNEELIITDTLDHMKKFVDKFIIYDDCSEDKTKKNLYRNDVLEIIESHNWKENRISEETSHRAILFERAKKYNPKWLFYFDADERFEGDIYNTLMSLPDDVDGIKVQLFDAYITASDNKPFTKKDNLYNFRKYFGIEKRNILMIFRNKDYIKFEGLDAREPAYVKNIITMFYCQHYGKAISIEQWESTCDYYSKYFPEPYTTKWLLRKGKAIHEVSDFGTKLYLWEDVKKNGTLLT